MQLFFYAISILGLAYFLLAKRRFDWFAVAFFSASIYFLPGFFGYTSYLSLTQWVETEINSEAYAIMILVDFIILFSAVISDLFSRKMDIHKEGQGSPYVLYIVLCIAITGLLLMLFTTGNELFGADKQGVMDSLNRSHILFYTAIMIGATMSFEFKRWKLFSLFCVLVIFDLFIGFRTSLAIAGISIFTLWLSKKGERRLIIGSWKPLLGGSVLGFLLFFYKEIAYAIKIGDWDLLQSLLNDPNTYTAMFQTSEPFIAQSILNEVTMLDYSVGWGHLMGIFYQFILFSPELTSEGFSFNALFQISLFPEVEYGMANNIWAEMWSVGGWPVLFLFLIIFALILKVFSILTNSGQITLRPFWAVMASYWAFYIHRNDISYEIVLEKRVLLIMMASLLIAILIQNIRKTRKNSVGFQN
jgi:hypothetical protein